MVIPFKSGFLSCGMHESGGEGREGEGRQNLTPLHFPTYTVAIHIEICKISDILLKNSNIKKMVKIFYFC